MRSDRSHSMLLFLSVLLMSAMLLSGCNSDLSGDATPAGSSAASADSAADAQDPGAGTSSDRETAADQAGAEAEMPEAAWETHTEKVGKLRREFQICTIGDLTVHIEGGLYEQHEMDIIVKDLYTVRAALAEALAVHPEPAVIYLASYLNCFSAVGSAWLNTDLLGTTRAYTQVLCTITGEEIQYGQAYGFTDALVRTLPLTHMPEERAHNDAQLAEAFADKNSLYLLDLSLPFFETDFVGEEAAALASSAAISFEQYYMEQIGREEAAARMLKTYELEEIDPELTAARDAWLASIGSSRTYEQQLNPTYIHNQDTDYPYRFSAYRTNWLFQAADVQDLGYPKMLEGFLDLYRNMRQDFDDAEAFLSECITEDIPPIDVYTAFRTEDAAAEYAGAIFIDYTGQIILYHDWDSAMYSLLHEYCHYLTISCNANDLSMVLYEGMAEAISSIFCENRMSHAFYAGYFSRSDKIALSEDNLYDLEQDRIYLDRNAYLNGALYYGGYLEDGYYLSITGEERTYHPDADTILPTELSYDEAAGFTAYLFDTYGTGFILNNSATFDILKEACGKDFRTLYHEWGAWNEEKCEELELF